MLARRREQFLAHSESYLNTRKQLKQLVHIGKRKCDCYCREIVSFQTECIALIT